MKARYEEIESKFKDLERTNFNLMERLRTESQNREITVRELEEYKRQKTNSVNQAHLEEQIIKLQEEFDKLNHINEDLEDRLQAQIRTCDRHLRRNTALNEEIRQQKEIIKALTQNRQENSQTIPKTTESGQFSENMSGPNSMDQMKSQQISM